MLALVHLAQGEADRARERSEAALELSSGAGLGEYWVNTAAHTARAGLLSRSGRAHEARVALDRALEVGRRGSGPVEMIHALVARGLAEAERDRVAARAFVAEARSTLMSCADPGPVVSLLVRSAEDQLSIPRRAVGSMAPVVEPFSERELDVLRLLGSELSQREIGDALFISFNTVKSHSKSLYRKLGVGTRREAVDRARGLDLL
jgi:LuxR family maltose regulon positive regulatory protein